MNGSEIREELHKLSYTAEVNQRYHQLKQQHMWWWDKAVKIGVAVLALFALLCVFLPEAWKPLEITVAILAAIAAVALNVVPVGEWMCDYAETFRSWSDVFRDAEQLKLKLRDIGDDEQVPQHFSERLFELVDYQCQLDASEQAPNYELLRQCQEDINERMYGKGIRTYEQAMAEHARLRETVHAG